jgi:hypothetical protein
MKKMLMRKNKIQSLIKLLKSAGLESEADQVATLGGEKTHLFITDFDGTLFRSPAAPALWKGGWWSKKESLTPPCVPESPGEDWWIPNAVAQCKVARQQPHTYSVFMTGRQENTYGERVRELLSQQSLEFDEINLSTGFDTVAFKSGEIKRILSEQPGIRTVKILDDRSSYLDTYKSLIQSIGPSIEVETELIVAASKGAECDEEPPENVVLPTSTPFIGLFLTSESKGKLSERFPAVHDNIQGESIPVILKPTKENIRDMAPLLGKPFDIIVTGYAKDEKGQVASVDVPGVVFPDGVVPQISISVAKGVKPAYNKELLSKAELTPVGDLTLKGMMWWK